MEAIPRNDVEQYRFDAFCKAVLRNEARNYHRNKKRLLDREKSFSVLSMEELGQLTSVDHYPCEESVFSSYGCDLHIDNELVANAFACTLAGFIRHSLIQLLMGKDLPEGINPSYKTFGYGGFFRYTLLFVVIHHVALFLIESLTLFDPLFLAIRIAASVVTTTLLICTIEAFNIGSQKSGD